jgi:hypothetical protein
MYLWLIAPTPFYTCVSKDDVTQKYNSSVYVSSPVLENSKQFSNGKTHKKNTTKYFVLVHNLL